MSFALPAEPEHATTWRCTSCAAITSTFWRNAWRYKARAYRHAFWDAGTSLANFLGVSASLGLRTTVVLGFADAEVNAVLGVDGEREATLALCTVGRNATPARLLRELPTISHVLNPCPRRRSLLPTSRACVRLLN